MGIEEIHSHKIIHMDIKPENFVFVNGNLKLIDLGLALCLPEEEEYIETSMVYGTSIFMAPECFTSRMVPGKAGVKPLYLTTLTLKADIWSAGVLLLQMLPVKEDCPAPSMPLDYIRNKIALREEELRNIMEVLSKCLQKDYKVRPTASQLREIIF